MQPKFHSLPKRYNNLRCFEHESPSSGITKKFQRRAFASNMESYCTV